VRLSRCATSMTLTSAAQSSCPTGVRPYQTVGGDVGLVERAMIPSRSASAGSLVSTLAETFRYQLKFGKAALTFPQIQIHEPSAPARYACSDSMDIRGGGGTLLRLFTMSRPSIALKHNNPAHRPLPWTGCTARLRHGYLGHNFMKS
jgi:hypothetical protein